MEYFNHEQLLTESTLADSFTFANLNHNSEMTRRIAEIIKSGTIVTANMIEEQILQIKRTRISPLVDKVLSAYENGSLVLLHTSNIKLPQALPFTVAKMGGVNKAFVFLGNYSTIVNGGVTGGGDMLNMNMKDLYVLMESAYIAYSYYIYPNKLTRNIGMMRFACSVYTDMFMRIMNKEYALSMDRNLYNRVAFVISKFFLERVWGTVTNDVSTTYAMSIITNPNKVDLSIVNDSYEKAGITDVEALIKFISGLSPRMAHLNMRYFMECYINMYKQAALLSMDCLLYFMFALIVTFNGSFLVNQPIIHDIITGTKGSNTFYSELSKVI